MRRRLPILCRLGLHSWGEVTVPIMVAWCNRCGVQRGHKGPVYLCEVCGGAGVERRREWDYCPRGHTYVGKRIEEKLR